VAFSTPLTSTPSALAATPLASAAAVPPSKRACDASTDWLPMLNEETEMKLLIAPLMVTSSPVGRGVPARFSTEASLLTPVEQKATASSAKPVLTVAACSFSSLL